MRENNQTYLKNKNKGYNTSEDFGKKLFNKIENHNTTENYAKTQDSLSKHGNHGNVKLCKRIIYRTKLSQIVFKKICKALSDPPQIDETSLN